jgi:hypothetical protein
MLATVFDKRKVSPLHIDFFDMRNVNTHTAGWSFVTITLQASPARSAESLSAAEPRRSAEVSPVQSYRRSAGAFAYQIS